MAGAWTVGTVFVQHEPGELLAALGAEAEAIGASHRTAQAEELAEGTVVVPGGLNAGKSGDQVPHMPIAIVTDKVCRDR